MNRINFLIIYLYTSLWCIICVEFMMQIVQILVETQLIFQTSRGCSINRPVNLHLVACRRPNCYNWITVEISFENLWTYELIENLYVITGLLKWNSWTLYNTLVTKRKSKNCLLSYLGTLRRVVLFGYSYTVLVQLKHNYTVLLQEQTIKCDMRLRRLKISSVSQVHNFRS